MKNVLLFAAIAFLSLQGCNKCIDCRLAAYDKKTGAFVSYVGSDSDPNMHRSFCGNNAMSADGILYGVGGVQGYSSVVVYRYDCNDMP